MHKSTGVTCGHCAWSTVLARHIASWATYVDVHVCVIYVCSTYAFSMYAFSMYASIRTAMQMKMG